MRRLAYRLLFWLTLSQITAVVVGMLLFPLFAPYTTYAQIAESTARTLLLRGLKAESPGLAVYSPDPEWTRYKERRPELVFAILDIGSRSIIAATDRSLAAAALEIAPFAPQPDGSLVTSRPGHPQDAIIAITEATPAGRFLVVTAGNDFGWEDASSFFSTFAPAMLPIYGPVFLGAFIAIPILIRRILAPLDALTALAKTIDITRSRQRLPDAGLDAVFVPLIASINAALDRLDDGLARQRLYAANAAHELRTPVAILRTRVSTLPEGSVKLDLERDTQRIQTLVEQLLSIARLGQQQMRLEEPLDLVAIAKMVVADRAPLSLRSGKSIAFETRCSSRPVKGNAGAIVSAIANLVDNAMRAEPSGGQVEVRVLEPCSIEVVDHGPGIAAEDAERIFEPFWRKTENSPGTGLGLAVVREVMRLHGGSVALMPTPGGGATFRLLFPPIG